MTLSERSLSIRHTIHLNASLNLRLILQILCYAFSSVLSSSPRSDEPSLGLPKSHDTTYNSYTGASTIRTNRHAAFHFPGLWPCLLTQNPSEPLGCIGSRLGVWDMQAEPTATGSQKCPAEGAVGLPADFLVCSTT